MPPQRANYVLPTRVTATVEAWGGHGVDLAFDNDVNTYYDANGRGSVVEACFGVRTEIGTIQFYPRKSPWDIHNSDLPKDFDPSMNNQIHADRMKNGVWKCDDSSIATTTSVNYKTWNQVSLPASVTCNCISFTFSSTGDYGSVAEISFAKGTSAEPPTMAPTVAPTMPPTQPPTMAPTVAPTMPPTQPPTMAPRLVR